MTGTAIADISHIPVSPGLSATLARASEGARASGAPEVSLEHVLAALCDDADAADVLAACAIDSGRLKADVIRAIIQQTGGAAQPALGPVTVSPALLRILEAAAAAARGGRRRDINGAIVLAAIVGDARSLAAQILQEHGLTFDEAIKALQAAQTQPPRPPVPDLPPPAEDVLARARERVQSRAAPSLREMMAMPQLAERLPPPTGFQDIVPSQAAVQHWPQSPAAAETTVASGPAGSALAAQPVEDDTALAPEAASAPEPVALPPAEPEVPAPPPGAAPEAAAPAPALEDVQRPMAQEAAMPPLPPPPLEPTPTLPEAATAPQLPPASTSSLPVTPLPPAAGHAGPRWAPAGDVHQQAIPPPAVHYPAGPYSGGPAPVYAPEAVLPPAPSPVSASFPPPSGYAAPVPGMPPLAGTPSHAMPPPPPVSPSPGLGPPAQGATPPLPRFPPPISPFPPAGPPLGGLLNSATISSETGRQGPIPPPIPPARAAPVTSQANRYGVPPSVGTAPQMPPPAPAPRSAAVPPARREAAAEAELGQLAENIPRTMRAGVTERVEIRLARAHVQDLTGGLDGSGLAWRHDVTVTKAMSVRLRAPEGGFFIETASPETQWIDNQFLDEVADYASWRFLITPNRRGWSELQIVVSARTVGSDGLAAETAFPDQHIDVKVRTNYGRAALKGLGWAAAAVAGGAIAKFGEGAFDAGSMLAARLLG